MIMFTAGLEHVNIKITTERYSNGADKYMLWCGAEWLHMIEQFMISLLINQTS